MRLKFYLAKFFSKFSKKPNEKINAFFRKNGAKIGQRCHISSNLTLCDTFMLSIGDDVIISTDVLFVTHDASFSKMGDSSKSLFGKITIGNNCFIGERSTILLGVSLANNIIVGAGSVVTKSFSQEKIIIAGNPARIIGTWDSYSSRYCLNGMLLTEALQNSNCDDPKFIKRPEIK